MDTIEHLTIASNGINLHVALQGVGPLVVLCHGNPGLWFSWRHQLPALAAAGYRAAAIDMRGYGRSDRPPDAELGDNTREFLYRLYWALSAKGNLLGWENYPMEGTGYLDVLAKPDIPLPWPWLSEEEFDYYVAEYEQPGPRLLASVV